MAHAAVSMRPVAETHPYRNRMTGLTQEVTDDAAAVFGDLYERLPDDYEAVLDEKRNAEAEVEAAKPRTPAAAAAKARAAKATRAAEKAAAKIETVTPTATEVEQTSGD